MFDLHNAFNAMPGPTMRRPSSESGDDMPALEDAADPLAPPAPAAPAALAGELRD